MWKGGWVYIVTNRHHSVLYTGVTSVLKDRVYKHRTKFYQTSFTAKYHVYKLVYFHFYPTIVDAIAEEKRVKGGNRRQKVALIESMNPGWRELAPPDADKSL